VSHAYCIDCGAITSCGDSSCDFCKDKIVPSDVANSHGHWGRCNECFAKLPEGTKSEYIISYEKDLSEITSELDCTIVKIRELKKTRQYLERRKELLQADLAKYSGMHTQLESGVEQ